MFSKSIFSSLLKFISRLKSFIIELNPSITDWNDCVNDWWSDVKAGAGFDDALNVKVGTDCWPNVKDSG